MSSEEKKEMYGCYFFIKNLFDSGLFFRDIQINYTVSEFVEIVENIEELNSRCWRYLFLLLAITTYGIFIWYHSRILIGGNFVYNTIFLVSLITALLLLIQNARAIERKNDQLIEFWADNKDVIMSSIEVTNCHLEAVSQR
jgi:hypothetical protein